MAKPNSVREGVKYLHPENSSLVNQDTDVFLVTLNKSDKEFSESTRYEDYSINDRLFHWQSQNATTPESPTGQRYIHQREKGNIVLLFVRDQKKDSQGNSQNYTFLGTAQLSSWSGSQPITIMLPPGQPHSPPSILPPLIVVGCCEKRPPENPAAFWFIVGRSS
ncbi:DUF3427 domain-containing protein [Acidaminococcus sp.]|uniref:DUF3427 domain-containing protein n=1 Tax=Acidaminococcus sp. TaxID=1872103 RepID=UPI00352119FE